MLKVTREAIRARVHATGEPWRAAALALWREAYPPLRVPKPPGVISRTGRCRESVAVSLRSAFARSGRQKP